MKRGWCAICLVALLCAACAYVAPRVEYVSPYGQPAGYYPGRGDSFATSPELTAWLSKNQAGIDDVQNRIVQIREGKRAPGCIGDDKYTCVATLAQKLAVSDNYALRDLNLFADIRHDVNGRPLNGSKVTFNGFIPNAKGDVVHRHATFYLTLGDNGAVSAVEA